LQKSVVEMPGETGDSITYQFDISHTANSNATAYDVGFTDPLPSGLTALSIDSAVDGNNNPVAGFSLNGNSLEHAGFDLPHGETVTVVLSGTVTGAVDAGDTIDNTAAISWSSLDTENPADGADSFNPLAETQQSVSASDSFSIADLHKSIVSTSIDSTSNSNEQVVVGEYITYQLVVDVPQGVTALAEIHDTLDQGLAFDSLIGVTADSNDVTTDIGAGDFSDIVSPVHGTTGLISFPLGTINNSDFDNTSVETLTLTYRVYVANESAVQPGVLLGNNATLRWDIDKDGQPDNVTSAAASPVTVLQPVISVSKSSDDSVPHLGQTLTYTVTVTNEPVVNGADARDVSVVDVLPAGAVLDTTSIKVDGASVAADANVTDLSSGNTLALAFDNVSYGSEVIISYQAILTEDTDDYGSAVDNTVSVEWSSLSGADSSDGFDDSERNSADGLVTSAGNTITLTAPDYQLKKSSSANGAVNAGDSLTYTLQVTNIGTHEGTGVLISDQFPVEALGEPVSISADGSFDPNTGMVSWLIPSLAINESVTLTVDAMVENPQAADIDGSADTNNDEFANAASVTDDGQNGGDPDLSNNSDSVTDQIIAAPDYTISKTNNSNMVAPTQPVSYVITAGNVGTQNGTNVVITDQYPADILSIIDPAGGSVDSINGTITWNISEFVVGQTETFEITAEVLPTASLDTVDQLFTNSVSVTDDGANGADANLSDNEASESDMLLAGAGEPLILAASPESVGVPPTASSATSESKGDSVQYELPNTSRIITTDFMKGGKSDEEKRLRPGENDVLNGGDLLDEFSLRAPEIHCAPNFVTYDYESDPASLELLDWLQDPSDEVAPEETTHEDKPQSDNEAPVDTVETAEVTLLVDPAESPQAATTVQQQIMQEAENLYGAGKKELLEAFKDSA